MALFNSNNKILIALALITLAVVLTATASVFLFFQKPQQKPALVPEVAKPQPIKILLAGDLMFDRGIRYYAGKNGGNNFILDKISDFLKSNDLNVANLEGPITDNKSKSAGTAAGSVNNYYFTFDPSIAKTLYDENIKIVDIGNNHILNFGRPGLAETKKYLDQARVGYFGSPDYPKSVATEIKNVKIAFVGYNQFSDLKDAETPNTIYEIQKAKKYADIVIVFCHWGNEYETTPTQEQINFAHQFIDAGADLVVGAHPHVIQPNEIYKDKKIYYSLGNFIFDQHFSEDVRNGLGVVVLIDPKNKQLSFREQNFYLDNNGQTVLK